jgi:hypothetical protein
VRSSEQQGISENPAAAQLIRWAANPDGVKKMVNTKQQRNNGKGKRLLIALLFLPIIIIIASAFSGVRAALFGADTEEIADLILQSASLACIIVTVAQPGTRCFLRRKN